MSRGSDTSDVTVSRKVVGYVVKPSRPGGKWHCYVDKADGTSRHVGWASDQVSANEKVRRFAR